MGGNIKGGQAVISWPGGCWGETVCHHLLAVHVVGGQAGWPETVAEDVEGISVDWWVAALWVVVYCSMGGKEVDGGGTEEN